MTSHFKSVVKGITYRIMSTFMTVGISFSVTGSAKAAFAIGGVEVFVKVFTYYLHERAWKYFGKKKK